MTDQSSHLMKQIDRMDDTLAVLRTQSAATLAAAQISALSILVPLKEKELDAIRSVAVRGIHTTATDRLPTLEKKQADRLAQLETLLEQLREEISRLYSK